MSLPFCLYSNAIRLSFIRHTGSRPLQSPPLPLFSFYADCKVLSPPPLSLSGEIRQMLDVYPLEAERFSNPTRNNSTGRATITTPTHYGLPPTPFPIVLPLYLKSGG